ncbi:MAG TPA: acyltransferase [Candidatus Dormibacteraeota bacterium]|nr:acyltransferase [Candidatus Dormibacteraeota bacterium]
MTAAVSPESASAALRDGDPGLDAQRSTRRKDLGQADLVRAAAAILVVVIHCTPWPSHATTAAASFYNAMNLLSLVSVPLFVVLSGLLLAYSNPTIKPRGQFWSRRLRRTLLPWLLWAGIYFPLTVGFGGMSPAPAADWGWWAGGAGHLYFLVLIPQLYVLYLVWPKGRVSSVVAMGLAVSAQVVLQLLRVVLPIHGGAGQIFLLDYGFEEAPFWMGYFAIGVVLGVHPEWLRSSRWQRWFALPLTLAAAAILLAGLPGRIATNWGPWVGGTGGFLRPSLVLLTAVVFFDLWALSTFLETRLRPWQRRTVVSLSRHSLGIYVTHPIFLLGVGPLMEMMPRPVSLQEGLPWSLLPFGILVVGATAFGWFVSSQLASHRETAWAVGESTRRPARGLGQASSS